MISSGLHQNVKKPGTKIKLELGQLSRHWQISMEECIIMALTTTNSSKSLKLGSTTLNWEVILIFAVQNLPFCSDLSI